jgi:hypothetical protein
VVRQDAMIRTDIWMLSSILELDGRACRAEDAHRMCAL